MIMLYIVLSLETVKPFPNAREQDRYLWLKIQFFCHWYGLSEILIFVATALQLCLTMLSFLSELVINGSAFLQ